MMLLPDFPAPDITLELTDGLRWSLDAARTDAFTMIVFYRGLHCPICRTYLRDLATKLPEFEERGVDVVAVSMDSFERARAAVDDWELGDLRVGWGLSEASAREWGLYISEAIKGNEPARFSEPGLFLVRRDSQLQENLIHYVAISSMPFGRPSFDEMICAIDFILVNDYPARGSAIDRPQRKCA